jgi:hypothetical protein
MADLGARAREAEERHDRRGGLERAGDACRPRRVGAVALLVDPVGNAVLGIGVALSGGVGVAEGDDQLVAERDDV